MIRWLSVSRSHILCNFNLVQGRAKIFYILFEKFVVGINLQEIQVVRAVTRVGRPRRLPWAPQTEGAPSWVKQ